jgi:hypothetical protein
MSHQWRKKHDRLEGRGFANKIAKEWMPTERGGLTPSALIFHRIKGRKTFVQHRASERCSMCPKE